MRIRILIVLVFYVNVALAQSEEYTLISAKWLFDGETMHEGWSILTKDNKIVELGTNISLPPTKVRRISFTDGTIIPGMIEGHSHLLLHPYNETGWNDQVLKESHAERAIRGANHAEATLRAGFTTVRDLGSEGAGYVDVGLKQAIEKKVIPGPRMIVAGKAIVTTGSYGPKGFQEFVKVPLGAEPADGHDDLIKVVRDQIGNGADVIKVYADYRWGLGGSARPTFTQEELELIVKVTQSSGRKVVAHAASKEGMRRAILAGVSTIEHGDEGDTEVFQLMEERGVGLCPTLAAGDAIMQYRGWKKGVEEEPQRIKDKKASFRKALEAGVTIVAGGDVGVFTHGDNVRELEMMVDYGMSPEQVMKSVTSVNADIFGYEDQIGRLKKGLMADIVVVDGNPLDKISLLRNTLLVMKDGEIYFEK